MIRTSPFPTHRSQMFCGIQTCFIDPNTFEECSHVWRNCPTEKLLSGDRKSRIIWRTRRLSGLQRPLFLRFIQERAVLSIWSLFVPVCSFEAHHLNKTIKYCLPWFNWFTPVCFHLKGRNYFWWATFNSSPLIGIPGRIMGSKDYARCYISM